MPRKPPHVLGHLLNPHMPSQNKQTRERNIFYITEDGQVSQFMMEPVWIRNLERVPVAHIPLWFRRKQLHGWIPVTISSKGKVVE